MSFEEHDLEAPGPGPREVERLETRSKLIELQESLGFAETKEMRELRKPLIEAMTAGNHTAIKDLLTDYQVKGQAVVEALDGENFAKGQIGLIIATGLLWQKAGRDISYGVELHNAWEYAHNMRFEDAAQILDDAYIQVEGVVKESEESDYVGPPTEEIIAVCKKELPVELHEELDFLYSLPPDEVFDEVASLMAGEGIEETPQEFFARMGWTEG